MVKETKTTLCGNMDHETRTEDLSDIDELPAELQARMKKCEEALDQLAMYNDGMIDAANSSLSPQHFARTIPMGDSIPDDENLVNNPILPSDPGQKICSTCHITGFTKLCTKPVPTETTNCCQPAAYSSGEEWADCSKDAVCRQGHSVCCGPSRLRPIFDIKVKTIEEEIVKHCYEIKESNILLARCCRAKDTLLCQKNALHNVLLKICEQAKKLEQRLHSIKVELCCPNMPTSCLTDVNCREEITTMRRLENKIDTLTNGLQHKECLLGVCETAILTMQDDRNKWDANIEDINKIEASLKAQLDEVKGKVCKPAVEEERKRAGKVTQSRKQANVNHKGVLLHCPNYVQEVPSSEASHDRHRHQSTRKHRF